MKQMQEDQDINKYSVQMRFVKKISYIFIESERSNQFYQCSHFIPEEFYKPIRKF